MKFHSTQVQMDQLEDPEHRDTQGYYRVLRVKTHATPQEIQLAYEMLTEWSEAQRGATLAEIQRAYGILANPYSRIGYDRVCTSPDIIPKGSRRPLDDWRILIGCAVLFFAIIGFVWVPLYGNRFKSFAAGDRLIDEHSQPFGVVVETAQQHEFPGGIRVEGILVDLHDGDLQWFPAADIRAACRKAK